MELVSEQTDADIEKRRTDESLTTFVRVLTSNLLRIMRGAGKPETLVYDLQNTFNAVIDYREAHGHYPSRERWHRMLDADKAFADARPWIKERSPDDAARWAADGTFARKEALRTIRRESLQIAASMLVNHLTQMSRAEDELCAGIRAYQDAIRQHQEAAHLKRKPPGPGTGGLIE